MDYRAGSELYIYDVAVELLKRGHQPIAFSTVLGRVAERLRAATIPVVDDLTRIGTAPDIIHGQHHFETLLAVLGFPNVPAINFCHGWMPSEEQPLIFPRVMRYVAVDHTCRDRLQLEHGIRPESISLILNFVDTERFRPRPPLPAAPRRALAFGHLFGIDTSLPILRAACRKAGIELDVAGGGSNQEWAEPEVRLGEYDLVFAKARAALEAMAVGAAVVLCGPRGLGPMVTPEEWERLRLLNFGVRALTQPITVENVLSQIAHYDLHSASAVSARTRKEATLPEAVEQLLGVYQDAIRSFSSYKHDAALESTATARYLREWAPVFKGRMAGVEAMEDSTAQLREAERQMEDLVKQLEESAAQFHETEKQKIALEQQLALMRDSTTWRLAQSASQSAPMRLARPLLKKLKGWVRNKPPKPLL